MTDKNLHISNGGELQGLNGRVIVVTGGSGNIGSAIARRLALAGAKIVIQYHRDQAGAEECAKVIRAENGSAILVCADLSVAGQADEVVNTALEELGAIDGLVNNAGIQPVAQFEDIAFSDFEQMMRVNVVGPFALMNSCATHWRSLDRQADRAVVNIASIEGVHPAPGHSHYATSKAAVIMLTKAAALELGEIGVRVNALLPGLIRREGIEDQWPEGVQRWIASNPLGRLGTPDDVADAALFLMSDAARWISGAALPVDGGMLARPTW
jgi:NAD(P)-dependent dehydrogenase (short-subunit alcohol dehydrogenase family)